MKLHLAVGALILGLAHSAAATTAIELPLAKLAERAELVVQGAVVDRESFWRGTQIFTRHHLMVDATWLGTPNPAITVVTLGGEVGGIGQNVAGSPVLRVGEQVVLFLTRNRFAELTPVALWQGVYFVTGSGPQAQVKRADGDSPPGRPSPVSLPRDLLSLRHQTVETLHGR